MDELKFGKPVPFKTKNGIGYNCRFFEIGEFGPGLEAFVEMVGESVKEFYLPDADPANLNHFYANPKWVLICPSAIPENQFAKAVEWAIVDWKKNLIQVLGAGPVRRMLMDMNSSQRTFATFGFLALSGSPVHPKRFGQLIK